MAIIGTLASGGAKPSTPTIGTATDLGTNTNVSVAFTPSTYIGKGTITYTATSSPGNLTGSGASSPITVGGLTLGTAYTFTVAGTTNYGVTSASSSASNSVTPTGPVFEAIATYNFNGSTSYTISSIPQGYRDLKIRGTVQFGANGIQVSQRYNGVSTSSYNSTFAEFAGATTYSQGNFGVLPNLYLMNSGQGTSANSLVWEIDIMNYTDTNTQRSDFIRTFSYAQYDFTGGIYYSASAVSSITFLAGGTFSNNAVTLYGIGN